MHNGIELKSCVHPFSIFGIMQILQYINTLVANSIFLPLTLYKQQILFWACIQYIFTIFSALLKMLCNAVSYFSLDDKVEAPLNMSIF